MGPGRQSAESIWEEQARSVARNSPKLKVIHEPKNVSNSVQFVCVLCCLGSILEVCMGVGRHVTALGTG